MAITKIHAVKVRLGDAINYIENPDKTDGQELISGYNTAPQTAVLDFSITAAMARKARNTSAKKQGNLAYHMIQSFSPDDAVTPERAHELGRKLAMEFTDGKFEFVVATHKLYLQKPISSLQLWQLPYHLFLVVNQPLRHSRR